MSLFADQCIFLFLGNNLPQPKKSPIARLIRGALIQMNNVNSFLYYTERFLISKNTNITITRKVMNQILVVLKHFKDEIGCYQIVKFNQKSGKN